MKFRGYFDTMAGRLFVFLLISVVGAAALAFSLADVQRQKDLYRVRFERLTDRMSDFLLLADRASVPLRKELLSNGVTGIRQASGTERIETVDAELTTGLTVRTGKAVRAERAIPKSCFTPPNLSPAKDEFACWIVSTQLTDGHMIRLQVRAHIKGDPYNLNPFFALIVVATLAVLAFIAARMAAEPLGNLARAAQALGSDLDRSPLPEHGPYEVREAARAFNSMQTKLRIYLVDRTQLLASITHDLQTPMTRLRLRLEKVSDAALRSRLVDDLGTMQALIREGLDYARSVETNEPPVSFSLDQLLDLVVEDAAEGGQAVTFIRRCNCTVEARPRALQRCLANLLDNAVKYGGSVQVSAQKAGQAVEIRIRDNGPGIPVEKLEQAFEPFVRLQTGEGAPVEGIGLGLAIARMLAQKNGATLTLTNHPTGGLEACLRLPRGHEQKMAKPKTAAVKAESV